MALFIVFTVSLFFIIDRVQGFLASGSGSKHSSGIGAEYTNAQKIGRFLQTAITSAILSGLIVWLID